MGLPASEVRDNAALEARSVAVGGGSSGWQSVARSSSTPNDLQDRCATDDAAGRRCQSGSKLRRSKKEVRDGTPGSESQGPRIPRSAGGESRTAIHIATLSGDELPLLFPGPYVSTAAAGLTLPACAALVQSS